MLFSQQLLFSDKQAITVTANSTNLVDLSAISPKLSSRFDLGVGIVIPILIQVVTGFTTSANTLTVNLQSDDNEAFSSPKVLATVSAIPTSAMIAAGFIIPINYIPRGTNERYLRLNYTVSATLAAGKITAGVILGEPQASF